MTPTLVEAVIQRRLRAEFGELRPEDFIHYDQGRDDMVVQESYNRADVCRRARAKYKAKQQQKRKAG